MKKMKDLFSLSARNDSLGLCLSGGGALGLAHIGAIQSLEDHGIYPTHIAGSSMGAIIGVLYAAGYSPTDMMQMIKEDKLYKITKLMTFRPTFLKSGLSTHDLLRTLIKEMIPHNSFEKLKKKLFVCVTNLNNAEWEIIDSGDELDKWVSASASIPGIFETIKEGEVYYVDGGLLNNMPTQGIATLCQNIIGVDVLPHKIPAELKKPFDSLLFSIRAMQHNNSKEGRDLCQFIIEPEAIGQFHEFSFDSYQAIYQYGYAATTNYITDNPGILKLANGPHKETIEPVA
jgi:NTE family protein